MGVFNNVNLDSFIDFDMTPQIEKLLDMSYVGGFADGDGCIGTVRQRYKNRDGKVCHRLKFTLVQNNREVLEEVKAIIGECGKIYKLKRDSTSNRQSYQLVYDSAHALRAIRKARPFLRRKKYEAEIVERLWSEGKMGQRPGPKGWPSEIYEIREKWAQKLSRLK